MGNAPAAQMSTRASAALEAGVEMQFALWVLAFCPWEQRAAAAALSSEWRVTLGLVKLTSSEKPIDSAACGAGYWRFLCERLAEEHHVHVPKAFEAGCMGLGIAPPRGISPSWHELFLELFPLALGKAWCNSDDVTPHDDGWPEEEEEEEDPEGQRGRRRRAGAGEFHIGVATRFRPARPSSAADELLEGDAVVLPLHQKAQLLRRQLGCSSGEAVAMIMRRRAGSNGHLSFATKQDDSIFQECLAPGRNDKENVPVKPVVDSGSAVSSITKSPDDLESPSLSDSASGTECAADARCSILAVREEHASVLAVTRQSGLRDFRFDRVFSETMQQADVYELSARRLVMDFLNGRSASIICYGQTGSGKTYTMFQPPVLSETVDHRDLRGIVPRAFDEIFDAVGCWNRQRHEIRLGVSYVELFGNEVSDLLREGQVVGQGLEGRYEAVRATDRVGHRYVLDGHTECFVDSWDEVDQLLKAGDVAKRRAATAMNERSTRAHTVLVLSLRKGSDPAVKSRFYFADLGGSEQVSKSKADAGTRAPVTVVGGVEQSRISWHEYYQNRQRIQETQHINKGLFALKRVIEALHRRSSLTALGVPQRSLPYVPYQDSKLTMLLQEALGGSAKTLIVATSTMDPMHATESLQTLRFAETCAQVLNRRDGDQAASVQLALQQIEEEIIKVESDIRKKERWETQRIRRPDVDTRAGAFGDGETYLRDEVVTKTVAVGAEVERERLERLLLRQQELRGLTGADFGKHYADANAMQAADGGKGVDFREKDRFSAHVRARDFENEAVLVDAIRFFFRKAVTGKAAFGETDRTMMRRLPKARVPAGYFRIARKLRDIWEDDTAAGRETRSLGKAMLDKCQGWKAELRGVGGGGENDPQGVREGALRRLLEECDYAAAATPADHLPISVAEGGSQT